MLLAGPNLNSDICKNKNLRLIKRASLQWLFLSHEWALSMTHSVGNLFEGKKNIFKFLLRLRRLKFGFKGSFTRGKFFDLLWQKLYAIGQSIILADGQILKK